LRALWILIAVMLNVQALAQAPEPTRKVTYYHTDALGSIIAASDEQGDVIWEKSYDPYGKEVISTEDGEAFEGQAYTGKPYNGETGLVYLGQRYYDPELRRFMGIDPVGFRASNPASFNRYTYANNNPYRFVDPDGRDGVDIRQNILTRSFGSGQINRQEFQAFSEVPPEAGLLAVGGLAAFGARAAYLGYSANAYRLNQAALFGGELVSPVALGRGGTTALVLKSAASRDGGAIFDLALGLGRHQESGSQLLRNFAKHTGSKTYGDIYGYLPAEKNILQAINDAKSINFNLDKFSLSRFKDFLRNPKYGDDNITNWELYTILTNPSFLNKTTFYGSGGVKVAAPIID